MADDRHEKEGDCGLILLVRSRPKNQGRQLTEYLYFIVKHWYRP